MKILVHIGLLYFVKKKESNYFDSFGVEHIPEEIKEFIGNKNIKANIFQVQANNSVMWGYFCIGYIDFILADKKLTDFTNLFSYDLSYFKDAWKRWNKIVRSNKAQIVWNKKHWKLFHQWDKWKKIIQ